MELEIRKLNAKKAYAGEFSFDYIPPADLNMLPLCKIEGAVKVSGEYEIFEDDSVDVTLTVSYLIAGQCSYCLAPAQKRVEFTSEIKFVTEKDDDNYYYDGIKLNLCSAVNDAILISQPNVLLCKEDCKGIDVT